MKRKCDSNGLQHQSETFVNFSQFLVYLEFFYQLKYCQVPITNAKHREKEVCDSK